MTSALQSFPEKLYFVLNVCAKQGREDIISWENNGTAFRVNDLEAFERDLLPRWFNTNKYNTFTRGLHSYGFTCVRAGRQTGVYSHPNFNRNDPISISLMQKVSKTKKTSSPSRPGTLSNVPPIPVPVRHFPSLNETDAASVFGQPYHTVSSQVTEWATSLPTRIPSGSELQDVFDSDTEETVNGENGSTKKSINPKPKELTSTTHPTVFYAECSIAASVHLHTEPRPTAETLFSFPTDHQIGQFLNNVNPIAAPPSRESTNGPELAIASGFMPSYAAGGNPRLQDQDELRPQGQPKR